MRKRQTKRKEVMVWYSMVRVWYGAFSDDNPINACHQRLATAHGQHTASQNSVAPPTLPEASKGKVKARCSRFLASVTLGMGKGRHSHSLGLSPKRHRPQLIQARTLSSPASVRATNCIYLSKAIDYTRSAKTFTLILRIKGRDGTQKHATSA